MTATTSSTSVVTLGTVYSARTLTPGCLQLAVDVAELVRVEDRVDLPDLAVAALAPVPAIARPWRWRPACISAAVRPLTSTRRTGPRGRWRRSAPKKCSPR